MLAHTLTILSVQIQAARQLVRQDPEHLASKLDEMASLLKESMAESRRVVGLLREPIHAPSEKNSVDSILRMLMERFGERTGVRCVFEEKGIVSMLNEKQVETLQFALQAALTNAHRHGSAQHVWVELDWSDSVVTLQVRDDGQGETTPTSERKCMKEHKIRVALADDQRLLRDGLRIILEAAPDIEVVGEAGDGVEATQLAERELPDVMLMDIRMPLRDGIAATEAIRKAFPGVRVLLLTTFDTPELVIDGLRAGAAGYLLKDSSARELCAAVRTVARGQMLLQTNSAAQLLAGMKTPSPVQPPSKATELGLTERECDVLRLVVLGRKNNEIATELYVREATVKTHINHLFAKLGARDRGQAIALAHQFELV